MLDRLAVAHRKPNTRSRSYWNCRARAVPSIQICLAHAWRAFSGVTDAARSHFSSTGWSRVSVYQARGMRHKNVEVANVRFTVPLAFWRPGQPESVAERAVAGRADNCSRDLARGGHRWSVVKTQFMPSQGGIRPTTAHERKLDTAPFTLDDIDRRIELRVPPSTSS